MTLTKGKNVIISKGVVFGENVILGNNVIIKEGSIIGDNVTIMDNSVIGKKPTKAKNSILPSGENHSPAIIGNGVTIGTSSIIYINVVISDDVYIADMATVRERVQVGNGTIIGRGVSLENDCVIGENCKLETNCYITAYSTLYDYVFIAPCVVTTNDNFMGRTEERLKYIKGVTVHKGGRIGANSTILPGKVIYEEGMVAAGSVVTKDVEKRTLVAGCPAKIIRKVPKEQLLKN